MKDESPAVKDWTPKYTPDQRRALIAAVLDDHIKVPQVIQLASQGELGDLEPFTVPLSSAYSIVDKERRRRYANRTAEQLLDDLNDRMLHRAAEELTKLNAKPRLSSTEIGQLRGWVRLSREVGRPKPPSSGQREPTGTPEPRRERTFIDDLAEQATARAAEAQEEPAETPTSPTEEPSTPNPSPTVTDAQRKAAQALLTAGNGLGSLTS